MDVPVRLRPLLTRWKRLTGSVYYLHYIRWLSLLTVMAGVSLVGFSGSLVKDAVKETAASIPVLSTLVYTFAGTPLNGTAPVPPPEPIESPEVTKVLLGASFSFCSLPDVI